MEEILKGLLGMPQMRKKFLVVYLKGCITPVIIPVVDTEATYKKIKKHLSKVNSGKLMKEIVEKKIVDGKGTVYTIPLDQVIAVGIQDLSQDYDEFN